MSSARCLERGQIVGLGEPEGPVEVLGLDLEGAGLTTVGQPDPAAEVRSWLISRMARMGFSSVMSRSTTLGLSSMRSRIEQAPTLRKVAYSFMLESPTMTCSRR